MILSVICLKKLNKYSYTSFDSMNPLFNPVLLWRIAKSYLFDLDRVWRCDEEEIRRYQAKSLRRIVKYAYTVPLYHKKYKDAGVVPQDIKGVEDLDKLPLVTKKDLSGENIEMLLPKGSDVNRYSVLKTSGSSTQPVSLYRDPYTTFRTFIGFLRILREHGINWRKTRMVITADLSPDSVEDTYFSSVALPSLNVFFSMDHIRVFHVGVEPIKLLESIAAFKPDFIGGYPGILKMLAILKRKGNGKGVEPCCMATSGELLDGYTREYIENAFNTKLFDMYGTTECSPMAFQCKQGNYHVNSDFVHIDFINPREKEAVSGDGGNIVITRLFGGGTPLVNYTGVSDFVVSSDKKCDCGLHTPLIAEIEGRRVDSVMLPNGSIITPLSVTKVFHKAVNRFHTDKIEQFQIIQRSKKELEVLVVVDEQLRDVDPKVDKLFEGIRREYMKKIGGGVSINVQEVDEIKTVRKGSPTPPPVVMSKLGKKLVKH